MASYTKPDERLSEEQLTAVVTAALPPYAYHVGREWTWTRPGGVWRLNLVFALDHGGPTLKVRLDGAPSQLQVLVRTTRREVDAALRFLVLVDAIDHHPDDPIAASAS